MREGTASCRADSGQCSHTACRPVAGVWVGVGHRCLSWDSFSGSVTATSSCLIKYSQEALQNGHITLPLTQKPEGSRFCPSSSARGITYLSNLIIVLICTLSNSHEDPHFIACSQSLFSPANCLFKDVAFFLVYFLPIPSVL